MGSLEVENSQLLQQCQADVLNFMFGYAETMALKSAVELRIADIIYSHGQPMALTQIASKIDSPSPDITCLARIMRLLVRKRIFTVDDNDSSSSEGLYWLTPNSKLLLHDSELSLAPLILTLTHPWMIAPWQEFSRSIKESGTPFFNAHGQTFWERGAMDPTFNKLFNNGMVSITTMNLNAILSGYGNELSKIDGTLVDVGGGVGQAVAAIVKAHPHIKGVNFDLPHVVATAPQYPGVTHVGGDMFKDIPSAEVVFIKSVLHDWNDEDCLKILSNCRRVVSSKKGKVIIVDIVINPQEKGYFEDTKLFVDLLMMANSDGGKERTHDEFNKLLKEAGFASHNVITIPSFLSIIEAYPN